jgi:hypothetical protein
MTFDLDEAINEVVAAALDMFADYAIDETAEQELRTRAAAFRADHD